METTITGFKKNITLTLEKLEELRQSYDYLESSIEILNEEDFSSLIKKIEETKLHLEDLVKNSEKQQSIKNKLLRRAKKRRKIKQKHSKKLEALKNRQSLHKKIDESLEIINQNNIENLARKQAAEYAATILEEINKKKSESLKYINLIKSLRELRILRKNKEKLPDSNESNWNSESNQLLKLWEDCLEEYQQEESNLKAILAYNSKSLEDQWREVLFGDKERDRKIFEKSSLWKFLELRKIWDSYTVAQNSNYGTSIPSGWVLPPTNPSYQWSHYLFKK